MKKLFTYILVSFLCLTFCGCSTSENTQAETTVDKFLSTLEDGQLQSAEQYTNQDTSSSLESLYTRINGLSDLADEYNADTDTKKKIDDALVSIIKNIFSSHTVESADKQDDDTYIIHTKVNMIPSDQINAAVSKIDYTSFFNEVQSEAADVYNNEGEDSANQFILDKLADFINEKYTTALKNTQKSEVSVDFTVKKRK